jgi:hypothetical protein
MRNKHGFRQIIVSQNAPIRFGDAAVLEWGFFGTHHQCVASLAKLDNPVKVRLPQKRLPAAGEKLALHLDPADLVLLTR